MFNLDVTQKCLIVISDAGADPGPQTQGAGGSCQEHQGLVYQSEENQSYLLHVEYVQP